ncbi:MAG: hypothetical protein WCW13_02320 [archaeon]|jgi:hypothetical protein
MVTKRVRSVVRAKALVTSAGLRKALAGIEKRNAKANKLSFEKPVPGRYSKYYPKGCIPAFFRSMEGEEALGSSSGWIVTKLKSATGRTIKKPPINVPQIKLVSGPELKAIFLSYLKPLSTLAKRKSLEKIPNIRRILLPQIQDLLVGIDWLEQTYKIKLDVDSEILKWVSE